MYEENVSSVESIWSTSPSVCAFDENILLVFPEGYVNWPYEVKANAHGHRTTACKVLRTSSVVGQIDEMTWVAMFALDQRCGRWLLASLQMVTKKEHHIT